MPESGWVYPFEQQKGVAPKCRHLLDVDKGSVIELLRDQELVNPAPFSHRTMVDTHVNEIHKYELPQGFQRPVLQLKTVNMDVPIDKIIGIDCDGHYHNPFPGMTFRQALFECLHGAGLRQESLDFLAGDKCKDLDMPHATVGKYGEARSSGKLEIYRYGEWFVVANGKQRVVFAMFHIWQIGGTHIKNVNVII